MKKLLMGSIALTFFSVSILIFQFSCKKDATAQQTTSTEGGNQLGLILYTKYFMTPSGTPRKAKEIWISNIDGTNPRKVPIIITGEVIGEVKLSPNGKSIIFETELILNYHKSAIYSCSIDGSNLKRILDFDNEFIDNTNYSRINLGSVN